MHELKHYVMEVEEMVTQCGGAKGKTFCTNGRQQIRTLKDNGMALRRDRCIIEGKN